LKGYTIFRFSTPGVPIFGILSKDEISENAHGEMPSRFEDCFKESLPKQSLYPISVFLNDHYKIQMI
jgi:hypothetical protein